jgi:hypothetical protein
MSNKRNKDKGRMPPFVAIYRHTIKSPAWKALSVGARSTFLQLKSNYNTNAQNAVFLSARDAAKEFDVSKNTAGKWLHELEHYGFIVMVQGAHLGATGKGKAARYRLTDCHYAGQAPSYDFQDWDGVLFDDAKKQKPVPKTGTPCPKNLDIRAEAGIPEKWNKRPKIPDIRNEIECPKIPDITSLNHIPPVVYDTETAITVRMLRHEGKSYREINKQLERAGTKPPCWVADELTDAELDALRRNYLTAEA